jgi:adenylate cyclase
MQEADPELLDERAALIAQHFEQAGEAMDAAQWHARAAAWAGFTDPNAALAHWKRIRELDPELPAGEAAYPLRVGARTMVMTMGWRLGLDVEEARELFEEGTALAGEAGDSASLAMMHGVLGIIEATCAGDVPEYVRHVEEAQQIAEAIDDPSLRVAAATAPMYAYHLSGRYEEALAALDKVLELTADDPELGAGIVVGNPRAWATSFRAGPLMYLGRMEEARAAIAEGTELCRRFDRESLGWTNTFAVSLAVEGADPAGPETVVHGRRAVEIAEEIGDAFSRIVAYSWLGRAHLLVGENAEAERVADHCLEMIAERGAGREFESMALDTRADARHAQGELDAALDDGKRALRLSEERGVLGMEVSARMTLAEILMDRGRQGDLERAAELLGEAESIARGQGMLPRIVGVLRGRARLCAIQEDRQARDALLDEALRLAREIDARGLVEQIETDLAEGVASR